MNIKYAVILFLIILFSFSCGKKNISHNSENDSLKTKNGFLKLTKSSDYPDYKYGVFVNNHNDTLLFRFKEPHAFDSSAKYPLIIFLHGAGERGNDNSAQLNFAETVFSDEKIEKNFPAFVLIPQCPEKFRWVEVDWSLENHKMPDEPSKPMELLISLLDKIISVYHPDTTRLYVTGLSMGGFGTFDILCRLPGKFAAGIPVCGGGDESQAEKLAGIPLWIFHGQLDKVVFPSRSVNMYNAILKAGGKPALTLYPDVAHGSWHNAFSEPDLFPWLFSQKSK